MSEIDQHVQRNQHDIERELETKLMQRKSGVFSQHMPNEDYYDVILQEANKDTVITESEFLHFLPLFQKQSDMDFKDDLELRELSEEYRHRVNLFRKVHIVDDQTGEELRTLPPHFMNVSLLRTKPEQEAFEAFSGLQMLDDHNPNSMTSVRTAYAQAQLTQAIFDANKKSFNNIQKQQNEFKQLADDVFSKNPVTDETEQTNIKPIKENKKEDMNPNNVFDFEVVDDD